MRYRYKLGFTEVDFARLMFSGDYYRWAERAMERWQQEMGLGWKRMIVNLNLGLPSLETRCHHHASIAYEDEFEIGVSVRDLSNRGFVSDFEFVRVADGVLAAHGYFVRRFLDMKEHRGQNDPPQEAIEVFSRMAEDRDVMPYEDRQAELRAARDGQGKPQKGAV